MKLINAEDIPYEEHYVPDPDSDKQWDYKKELCVLKPVIDKMPTIDAVSRGLFEQYKWERDVAISQLEELGISFGQKIDGVYLTKEEYEELLDYKWMYNKL